MFFYTMYFQPFSHVYACVSNFPSVANSCHHDLIICKLAENQFIKPWTVDVMANNAVSSCSF